jgi:hypothetical protein
MVKVAVDPLVNVPMVHASTTIESTCTGVAYIGIACWQYITNRYGCSCHWSLHCWLLGKDYVTAYIRGSVVDW